MTSSTDIRCGPNEVWECLFQSPDTLPSAELLHLAYLATIKNWLSSFSTDIGNSSKEELVSLGRMIIENPTRCFWLDATMSKEPLPPRLTGGFKLTEEYISSALPVEEMKDFSSHYLFP